MDDQGLSLEALEKHLRQSSDRGNSVLYTIPTNHNPTGRTLSRRRRIQLLELCNRYDLPIIEDGAYEELTFDGTPPPSLKSLDPGGRVLLRVRDALALGDDFRGIFRFVARADAAPFVNRMALSVCQRLLGPLGARRSVPRVCYGRRDAGFIVPFLS
ncbi:aminotransferase class I/II-fold pyridoxal phosphate-dependent enzyme [uncultured Megasphaera sp.]|uniref:aminotransferase class I/II-fold pyridoxal phosphate-dependent enzyme n=1 Tax=uncultured Megasphaera sp. TaxID=165188 RepID=UPI00266BAB30|nr:aminotransferase class I/II-fold pyridoxal phosphate-dependent enzyme [uncultured Megasphaera sp.]